MLRWLRDRLGKPSRELSEPFHADIVLDGVVVATLRDRVFTEMFWRSYVIEPVAGSTAIYDDELWNRGRFVVRDPATGHVTTGLVGRTEPFVRAGRVSLRGLYFARRKRRPR